jgi:hypothetical protein
VCIIPQPPFHAFRSPRGRKIAKAFFYELIKIKPEIRLSAKFQVFIILFESKALPHCCKRG